MMEKIVSFTLPTDIVGSFSFDENPKEENKLINVEARDGKWVIYSTANVSIMDNNNVIPFISLVLDSFYILKRGDKSYLIYVTSLSLGNTEAYQYDNGLNLIIGNDANANIQYQCPLLNNLKVKIYFDNDQLVLENIDKTSGVYVNNNALMLDKYNLKIGDFINIYGLKIMILDKLLLMNNPGKSLTVLPNTNVYKYTFQQESCNDVDVDEVNLYSQNDYFSKSPRIRRLIENKKIKISPPPNLNDAQEMPVILTVGPMLTMGATSATMLINTLSKVNSGQTTFKDSWTSIVSAAAMLISMLLWPTLTRMHNKKLKLKNKEEVNQKYNKYLNEKRQELNNELNLQKSIILENLVSVEECLNVIRNRDINFWSKRIEQNDFLTVRIGTGNEKFAIEVEYPEEGFSISEDELKKRTNEMLDQFKYIENVPVSYSFYDNIVTAIMGANKVKNINFMNNILVQLLSFYSYEDLKLVVFTNESNKTNWEYIKYLNHNFTNEKNFRFFASTVESTKSLSEYLNNEVSKRIESSNNNNNTDNKVYKPHYLIIIDDYERVKRSDAIKTITELEKNIGFSIVILEDRLSKLPSKCSNFITIGTQQSGALKNSYENQEQIVFQDEVVYNIDMMEMAKISVSYHLFMTRSTVVRRRHSKRQSTKIYHISRVFAKLLLGKAAI